MTTETNKFLTILHKILMNFSAAVTPLQKISLNERLDLFLDLRWIRQEKWLQLLCDFSYKISMSWSSLLPLRYEASSPPPLAAEFMFLRFGFLLCNYSSYGYLAIQYAKNLLLSYNESCNRIRLNACFYKHQSETHSNSQSKTSCLQQHHTSSLNLCCVLLLSRTVLESSFYVDF